MDVLAKVIARLPQADFTETWQTTHLPISTSFLPYTRDPLEKVSGDGPAPADRALLDPGLVAGSMRPVMPRFAEMRRAVTGKTDDPAIWLHHALIPRRREDPITLLIERAFPWQGYCDQWSAGPGSDTTLQKVLRSSSDLVCGGTYLSMGEVNNLATIFYRDYRTRKDIWSSKGYYSYGMAFSSQGIDPLIEQVYDETGMYVLSAADNENLLDNFLGHDTTVIENIHAPGQIWNYPVYRKVSRYHELSAEDAVHAQVPLPSYLFLDQAHGANADLLKAYAVAEKGLKIYEDQEFPEIYPSRKDQLSAEARLRQSEAERVELRKQAFALAERAGISPLSIPLEPVIVSPSSRSGRGGNTAGSTREQDPLLGLYRELCRRIGRKVESGEIRFDPSYQVQEATTELEYGKEAPFPENRSRTGSSSTAYYLIRKRGTSRYTDSRWITPVHGRPQAAWVAQSLAKPGAGNPYESVYGLGDLYQLLQSCTKMDEVHGFFRELQAAAQSGERDPKLWDRLRSEYARLKGVINNDKVLQILSTARGGRDEWQGLTSR